jgi:hypothetical protein
MGFIPQGTMATCHYLCGRHDEAASWAEAALQSQPNHLYARCVLVASYAMAGRIDEARRACVTFRQFDPGARVSTINDRMGFRREEDVQRLQQGLRLAGLPE